MTINKLLAAVVLAAAVRAPIAAFLSTMKGKSMTSTGPQVPFLHGFSDRTIPESRRAGFA